MLPPWMIWKIFWVCLFFLILFTLFAYIIYLHYLFTFSGDAPTKADVTISMNEEVFLKIFNRELAPASAFMTGKVKVSGDLAKALTLEKVMKATREAAESNKGAMQCIN